MKRKQYTQPLCEVEQVAKERPIMDFVILRGSAEGTGEKKAFDDPNEVF